MDRPPMIPGSNQRSEEKKDNLGNTQELTPGSVDQAIEVPLPDRDCRRRLFALYAEGLKVRLNEMDSIIDRTSGASAAFIRELMRKAALFAADEKDEIEIEDRHIDEALHELVIDGGELTKTYWGWRQRDITRPSPVRLMRRFDTTAL